LVCICSLLGSIVGNMLPSSSFIPYHKIIVNVCTPWYVHTRDLWMHGLYVYVRLVIIRIRTIHGLDVYVWVGHDSHKENKHCMNMKRVACRP
jgi:hypothetical protein